MRARLLFPLTLLIAGCIDETPSLDVPTDAAPAVGPDPQGVQLVVVVTDATSKAPIENATVRLRYIGATGADLETHTGAQGSVVFNSVPPGSYPLVVEAVWYKTQIVNLTLTQSATQNVELQRMGNRVNTVERGTSPLGLVFSAPDPALIAAPEEIVAKTGRLAVHIEAFASQRQVIELRLEDPNGKAVATWSLSGFTGAQPAKWDHNEPNPVPGTWNVIAEARACAPRCDLRVTWTTEGPWANAT